ncbi:MAG: hypothetical protein AAF335_01055 [Bacteroidota bacterium]
MILIRSYTFLIGAAFLFPVALHGTQNEEEQKIAQLLQLIKKQKTTQKKADLINNALKDETDFENQEFWQGLQEACKNDTAIIEHLVVPIEYVLKVFDDSYEVFDYNYFNYHSQALMFLREISATSKNFAYSLAKAAIQKIEQTKIRDEDIDTAYFLLYFLTLEKDGPKIGTKYIDMSFDVIKKCMCTEINDKYKLIIQFYLDHPKRLSELITEPWNKEDTRDVIKIITEMMATSPSNEYTHTFNSMTTQLLNALTLQKFREAFTYSIAKKDQRRKFPNRVPLKGLFNAIAEAGRGDIEEKLAKEIIKENTSFSLSFWQGIAASIIKKNDNTVKDKTTKLLNLWIEAGFLIRHGKKRHEDSKPEEGAVYASLEKNLENIIQEKLTLADVQAAYEYSYESSYSSRIIRPGRKMLRTILPKIPQKAIQFAEEVLKKKKLSSFDTFKWVRVLLIEFLEDENLQKQDRKKLLEATEKIVKGKISFKDFKQFYKEYLDKKNKKYTFDGKSYDIDAFLQRIVSKKQAIAFLQQAAADKVEGNEFIKKCLEFLHDIWKLNNNDLENRPIGLTEAIRLATCNPPLILNENIRLKDNENNREEALKAAKEYIVSWRAASLRALHFLLISSKKVTGNKKPLVDVEDIKKKPNGYSTIEFIAKTFKDEKSKEVTELLLRHDLGYITTSIVGLLNKISAKKSLSIDQEKVIYWLLVGSKSSGKQAIVPPGELKHLPVKTIVNIIENQYAKKNKDKTLLKELYTLAVVKEVLQAGDFLRQDVIKALLGIGAEKYDLEEERSFPKLETLHFLSIDKEGPQLPIKKDDIQALKLAEMIQCLKELDTYQKKIEDEDDPNKKEQAKNKLNDIAKFLKEEKIFTDLSQLQALQKQVLPTKGDGSLDWDQIKWEEIPYFTLLPMIADEYEKYLHIPIKEALAKIEDPHFNDDHKEMIRGLIRASRTNLQEALRNAFPDITVSPGYPPKINWQDADFSKTHWETVLQFIDTTLLPRKEFINAIIPGVDFAYNDPLDSLPSTFLLKSSVKWGEVKWDALVELTKQPRLMNFYTTAQKIIAKQVFPNIRFGPTDSGSIAWKEVTHFKMANRLIEKGTITKSVLAQAPEDLVKKKLSKATKGTPEAIFWQHVKDAKTSYWGTLGFVTLVVLAAIGGYFWKGKEVIKKIKTKYKEHFGTPIKQPAA